MKTYPAEMWDKMQNIMERYNDHMTHSHYEFDVELDFPTLRKAFEIAINKVPILKCRFLNGFVSPKWVEIEPFHIEDCVTLVTVAEDANKVSESFLLQKIDEEREAQIKVCVVRCKGKDTINILQNHMIMDGADIKLFNYFIADVYSDLKRGGDGNLPFKNGRRDEGQLYEEFTAEQRAEAEKLISYSKKQKCKISFPFETKNKNGCTPFIGKYKVNADTFLKLKVKGKAKGFTINDIITASYYRALYKLIKINPEEALGMPIMMDLRAKYLSSGQSAGCTNLTSMIVCHIGNDIGADIFDTCAKVKASIDELKKYYPGLHGIPLLRGVFKYTPYQLAKFLIGTFFKNPLIGISNIGIVDSKKLSFDGNYPVDAYFTGSVKYPPYIQLALTTFNNEITFTTAVYGTEKDKKNVDKLYGYYQEEIDAFLAD